MIRYGRNLRDYLAQGRSLARRLVQNLWGNEGTLSQRAARGGLWAFVSYGGVRILTVVRSIILARLLMPADFGLVGMAQVAIGFLAIWTEIGVAPALIYKQDAGREVLDTAWIISAGRGILLFFVTLLAAGPVAAFFKTPELTPIVRAMAFSFLGYGLSSIGLVLLKRDLEFRKLAYLELGSEILSLIVAVVAALVLRNAWAIVIATLGKVFIVLGGSYLVHPYRPRLRWRKQEAKGLVDYGRYILGAGIVNYFLTQGENAVVGRMLGTTALGYYGMAYNLANMPATSITTVIGQVAFPTYARLQHDLEALVRAYLRVLKLTAVLAVPMLGLIMVLAPELVMVLYGAKWMPIVVPLIILCIAGLERATTAPAAPLFNAMGRPKTVLFLLIVKLAILAALIFPLTKQYGIVGTSIATAITSIIVFSYSVPLVARLLQCKRMTLLRTLGGPFAAAGAMAGSLLLLKQPGWFAPNILTLGALVLIGGIIYLVALYAFDRAATKEVMRLIRSQLGSAETTAGQTKETLAE